MTHIGEEFTLRLVGDFCALLGTDELQCPGCHFALELGTVPQQATLVALHLRKHVVEIVHQRANLVAALRILRPKGVVLRLEDLVGCVCQCQNRRRYESLERQ